MVIPLTAFCRCQGLKQTKSSVKWQYKISNKKTHKQQHFCCIWSQAVSAFCGPACLGPRIVMQPFLFICSVDTDAHLILWWAGSGRENQQMFFTCLVFSYKDSLLLVYFLKQSKAEGLQGWHFRLMLTVVESQPEAIVQLEFWDGRICNHCEKKKHPDPNLSHSFQVHSAFSSMFYFCINSASFGTDWNDDFLFFFCLLVFSQINLS